MEQQGLLKSKLQSGCGRARRVYIATAAGKRALAEAKLKVSELYHEMNEAN